MPEIDTPANARSRRTRAALLASARQILEDEGTDALTMASVTAHAGFTRRAAYLHFGSRSALIGALFGYIADAEGLQESLERVWSAPDATAALDAWAAHLADYHPRLLAADRAITRARHRDVDAAAHHERVVGAQMHNCRRLAEWLDREHRLASGWSVETATDMLFAFISSDVIEALIYERNWSEAQLAEHLALVYRKTFVSPQPEPG